MFISATRRNSHIPKKASESNAAAMDAADQVANDDFGEANEGESADEEDEPSDEEPHDDAPVDQLSELQGCLVCVIAMLLTASRSAKSHQSRQGQGALTRSDVQG